MEDLHREGLNLRIHPLLRTGRKCFACSFFQFGISFAQKGFKVTPQTKFTKEPLQSLMKKEVPDGLFFAAQTKFAANCGNETVCKFGKILMGKNSWLKFHGGINTAGVKVAAGVYGIPIKGDLKFNKVELFLEVTTFLM